METIQRWNNSPDLEDYSQGALLRHLTRNYPKEIKPPSKFASELRHYQKQSLAFMYDIECATTANIKNSEGMIRGGWLSSEVGMGKTAVVLALIATNPATNVNPTCEEILKQFQQKSRGLIKVKTTIVLTSVSLLGQWQAECEKHAPHLVVKRYHPSSPKSKERKYSNLNINNMKAFASDLAMADAIITSATCRFPFEMRSRVQFYRVVIDESHLLGTASMRLDLVRDVNGNFRWCVTATPTLNSLERSFLKLELNGTLNSILSTKQKFYRDVERFKELMIRHTKDQYVNGAKALALPGSTTEVILVTMNVMEQELYKKQYANILPFLKAQIRSGAPISYFALQTKMLVPLSMNHLLDKHRMKNSTKVRTLCKDLEKMLQVEPAARVAIYSEYRITAEAVAETVKHRMTVYSFDGSTLPDKRDEAIKLFQSNSEIAAAFVITLRSGSVGITLTNASRVYLMEPNVDMAKEIQAAGRIHRLGQTKNVQVKKLVYKDSIEENILAYHNEIIAGRIDVQEYLPNKSLNFLMGNATTRKPTAEETPVDG